MQDIHILCPVPFAEAPAQNQDIRIKNERVDVNYLAVRSMDGKGGWMDEKWEGSWAVLCCVVYDEV